MQWSIRQLIYTLVITLVIIASALGFLFREQYRLNTESRHLVTHTYKVIDTIHQLFVTIKDIELNQRGYIITGSPAYLDAYNQVMGENGNGDTITTTLQELRTLTLDNPIQQQRVNKLILAVDDQIEHVKNGIELVQKGQRDAAVTIEKEHDGDPLLHNIHTIMEDMIKDEHALLDQRTATESEIRNETMHIIIAVIAVGGLIILIGSIIIIRSIRRQRQSEENERQLRMAMEHAAEGIALLDNKGCYMSVNKSYADTMGCEPHELVGTYWHDRVHNDDKKAVGTAYDAMLIHGKAEVEARSIRKDGSLFYQQIVMVRSYNHNKQPTGYYCFVKDINSRKQIEQMKDEFISTVSHELRTPLTSIRGSLGLITSGNLGELPHQIKNLIDIAHKNSERLVRLINDILDIEKIESGGMRFDMRAVSLNDIVEQTVEANQGFAEKYKVTFVNEMAETPIHARLDSDRFTQALTNLLSNAAKFSPSGGNITIRTAVNAKKVRISVSDMGPGIPIAFQNHIFEKFAQADSSDTRQKGGTGLGLSITKAIVERMEGAISFTSTPGQGTTFFMEFPLYENSVTPIIKPHQAKQERQALLICEDDNDIATLLHMIIERAGFEADIATSAEQAKGLLACHNYVGMTLDLMLPDEDGISLIRTLRSNEETAQLPIIVVSAKAEQGRKELNGDAIGIVDWFSKPIDTERLTRIIKSLSPNRKPDILHIEDDKDLTDILSTALTHHATLTSATTLDAAHNHLQHRDFDLIILDITLPDGSGLDILSWLNQHSKSTIPVIIFSADEMPHDIAKRVTAALVKSVTSEEKIIHTIIDLINRTPLIQQKATGS